MTQITTNTKSTQGASHLTLILFISFILILIVASIQGLAFIITKQVARTNFSAVAYFAAEGALFETTRDIETNYDYWTNLVQSGPYTDTYQLGDSTVYRRIENDGNRIKISITSDSGGARKKLVGSYKPEEIDAPTLDVVLVIDRSGSMSDTDGTGTSSIDYAKEAAKTFINVIDNRTTLANIGLVSFNHYADGYPGGDSIVPLSPNYERDTLRQRIDDLEAISPGGTNIPLAIHSATNMLVDQGRDEAAKVMIVLSDGIPQFGVSWRGDEPFTKSDECFYNNDDGMTQSCANHACMDPNSGWGPTNEGGVQVGNCCTDQSVLYANIARDRVDRLSIYSISLTSNYEESACGNVNMTQRLGSYTMVRISGTESERSNKLNDPNYPFFKETADPTELVPIFQSIGQEVTSPAFFQYYETEPESDPLN